MIVRVIVIAVVLVGLMMPACCSSCGKQADEARTTAEEIAG